MTEATMMILDIMFRSGRILTIETTNTEFQWMFDRMFGRAEGDFANFSGVIVNVTDIEYVKFREVENQGCPHGHEDHDDCPVCGH